MKHQSLKLALGAVLASSALVVSVLDAAPSISIKVTSPKGTGGEVAGKYLKKAAWTPCLAQATTTTTTKYPYIKAGTGIRKIDALEFELSIKNESADPKNKTLPMIYDTYFYFVPPENDTFYAVVPGAFGFQIDMQPRSSLDTVEPMIAAENFVASNSKVKVFGAPILLDGATLPQGNWKAVAFMVKNTVTTPATISKWEAFDVKSFVLGSPNPGSGTCN